jgi:hypothetical protein
MYTKIIAVYCVIYGEYKNKLCGNIAKFLLLERSVPTAIAVFSRLSDYRSIKLFKTLI